MDKILTLELATDPDGEAEWIEMHVRPFDTARSLELFRKYLNCEIITMREIDVYGHKYDVVADDEAAMNGRPVLSLRLSENDGFLGSIAFVRIDEEGRSVGLDDDDIERLQAFVRRRAGT